MTPQASPEQQRLDAIRNRASLASPRWGVIAATDFHLTAGEDGREIVATLARDGSHDDRELLIHAADDLRWLLNIYDRLVKRYQQLSGGRLQRPVQKDFARDCAITCGTPAFRKYLGDCHGLAQPLDDTRVATKVRSLLAIKSRAELNTDPAAAERWTSLKMAFEAWRNQ